jgi:hypothetical protein
MGGEEIILFRSYFLQQNIFVMTSSDWINIAICNQKRMIQDKSYTLCFTSQHDRYLEIWNTTNAALKLAQRASKLSA